MKYNVAILSFISAKNISIHKTRQPLNFIDRRFA